MASSRASVLRSAPALLSSGVALAVLGAGAAAQQGADRSTAGQLVQAHALYAANCAACHGESLAGGQFAGALTGPSFLARWGGVPAADLLDYIRTSMPPGGAGTLSPEGYAALTALILVENGLAPSEPLGADAAQLAGIALPPAPPPEEQNALGIGGISPRVPMPAWPEPVDRFADYTPVTQDMLSDPPAEDWLTWRRGHEGHGFSPLDQIKRENVSDLTIA